MTTTPSNRMLLHPLWTIAGLVVLALALWAGYSTMQAPAAKSANAPADEFAAGRALPVVERLLGEGVPHPVGSVANEAVRRRLVAELTRVGLDPSLQEEFVCRDVYASCALVTNVVARLDGREESPAVLVAAHYDSRASSPGASDDMAAVGAIVEVAGMLRQEGPLRNPVIFLITDGEEAGLLGAQAFADHHPWAQDVGVAVNLEARGSRGQSLLFEASGGTDWLIREFAREAPRPVANSLLYEIYQLLPNDTDFTVFREAGLAGINFAYAEGVAHYHTPLDNLQMMSRDSLQHHGDNLLAAVRAYGEADLSERPTGDALFIDLLPGRVAQVPIGWALPLGELALVAWLVLAGVAIRSGVTSLTAVAIGLVTTVVGLALAAVTAQAAANALIGLAGGVEPWHALPLPSRIAIWASAAAGLLIPTLPFASRVGFWGLTAGVWLLWALLDVLLAVFLPGASVITLVPLLVATVLLGTAGLSPSRRVGPAAALSTLAVVFVTAYVWLPTALTVELGLGFQMSSAIGVVFALAVSSALPLLASERHADGPILRRGVALPLLSLVLAAAAVGGVWAQRVPALTPDWPERMNILHYQEVGEEESAAWLVSPSVRDELPEAMRAAADFSADPVPALPWSSSEFFVAPAPAQGVAASAPGVEILADDRVEGERVLRLRLTSEREPLYLELLVEGDVKLREVEFEGGETIDYEEASVASSRSVTCYGPGCARTEVELRLAGGGGFDLTLVEHLAGLPASAEALLEARPATAVPSQDGDMSITATSVAVGEFVAD